MRLFSARTPIIALLVFFIWLPYEAFTQIGFEGTTLVDAKIDFKGHTLDSRRVEITYAIPFNGMVEFQIWDQKGDKVWENQYVNNQGKNRIVLKLSKFTPGKTYTYALNYKQDQIKNKLVVPPLGFE